LDPRWDFKSYLQTGVITVLLILLLAIPYIGVHIGNFLLIYASIEAYQYFFKSLKQKRMNPNPNQNFEAETPSPTGINEFQNNYVNFPAPTAEDETAVAAEEEE